MKKNKIRYEVSYMPSGDIFGYKYQIHCVPEGELGFCVGRTSTLQQAKDYCKKHVLTYQRHATGKEYTAKIVIYT